MNGFLTIRSSRFLIGLFISLGILGLLWPYGVIFYRTAYIVSHIIPAIPDWFEWGSYGVEMREISLENGQILDVYLPQGIERPGFMIFFPGFNPDGARDPRLVNLARSFAGAGIGVAVPDSENIKQQKFSRQDIALVKNTFVFLKDQSYTDHDRIALSGFSIAGSYILRAAAELGEGPLFVHALGAYYDLAELFEEVKAEKVMYGTKERPWRPSDLSKEIAGREFNLNINEEEARELSPAFVLKNIKSRVFLMHDINDDRIAVEHSRKIRDALPKTTSLSYSEFSSFRHVTPQTFLSFDILKLTGQMFSIMRLLL